jgi:glucokinase
MKKKITAGIDIGGTNTVFGFTDEKGGFLPGNRLPTGNDLTAADFISRLADNIISALDNYKNDYSLCGIGIAAPGANYITGTIEKPSNLTWENADFVSMMKEHFDLPVAIINDANAAALGEYYFGHAKGLQNFIVITLGTGVGAGIFSDGNLLFGERGLAGELGHVIVEPGGRGCNCGRFGCLETYVSAKGLRRTVFELIARSTKPTELNKVSFDDLTGKMISELASSGNPIALEAFMYTGHILGEAMANLAALFSPEMIVLFGGMVNSGELLLAPVRDSFEQKLLNVHRGKIKLVISKLNDATAGILGASTLILKELKKESFVPPGSKDFPERRGKNAK